MLLGGAELADGTSSWRLERKAAALLAYLALEGVTPRRVLAGLLWPDSGEVQARTNLRKVLLRLKLHPQLLSGPDPLQLTAVVRVDVLELLVESKQLTSPDWSPPGELLGGLDYDDCVDIADQVGEDLSWEGVVPEEAVDSLGVGSNVYTTVEDAG